MHDLACAVIVGVRPVAQAKLDRGWMREFGCGAEAAVNLVELTLQFASCRRECIGPDRGRR
ncbi:MAG TPA: hypothetical protein VJ011_06845, partial [Steroidobacteraceae bacterium]|nr:hypothetical protein [Steroidobacteraceae bacterium]